MKKVNVEFSIKGLDSEMKFKTNGEFKNNRLIFVDSEKNTNHIIIQNENIEYIKKGSVTMRYKFDLKNKTNGTYQVIGNEFLFNIETKTMKITSSIIYIEFNLYQGDDLINENTLDITYQEE